MSETYISRIRNPGRLRLWAEFIGFYVLVPLGVALFMPPTLIFPALFIAMLIGLSLLHLTPGFAWHQLRWRDGFDWRVVAVFTGVTLMVAAAALGLTRPEEFFNILRAQPMMLPIIIVFYPILSALPQEVVFRVLFYRRYGGLFAVGKPAMLINAVVFSLAHLMYWSWTVAFMTFFGGLIFSWAYEWRRSFALAVLLHAIAGWIIFTLGLGVFFYSGNVVRPF
ncbi:abortive infection protein [Actibacterium atlanticum]|uniref:Abortive infection protein n=1 Tax=Actibacterium atlanticum TaxID=1461693 RepID=A0A058ZPB8_9RHOB|nr:type II CAAX endopeptidase family protein [Actibacterium atlanticum]KCV83007.1 abortive infection protein [Actibacterium atlanticum]